MDKVWQVAPRAHDNLFDHLLSLRGLEESDLQQQFFYPSLDHLTAPNDFPDMKVAVDRIIQAINAGESMTVWGDFDADGVTSTAILWETLHQLGAKVLPYIPQRDGEGHGFSAAGLHQVAAAGTTLIVTVDHGVTAIAEVEQARSLGMEVIVTDHHQPIQAEGAYVFPQAVAVIHPFRLSKPQPLAGCGAAYYLAYAVWLASHGKPDDQASRQQFAEGRIELAALGTIADMMPLIGDNRVFSFLGLRGLASTERLGLQQLYSVAKLQPAETVSVYEVGFLIAPRLNAPGRLSHALDSLRLLCTKEVSRAATLAEELDRLNTERQELLRRVGIEAVAEAKRHGDLGAFVVKNTGWPAGVCGLAAGRVVEAFYRPAVVMEELGDISRGSARSISGFDITAALASMSDLLEHFGGHAMAAGFVAKTAHVTEIEQRLSGLVLQQLSDEQMRPVLQIDAAVDFSELTTDLYHHLKQLEPCGMGNAQPLFMAEDVSVADCRTVGAEAKHLKIRLVQDGQVLEAIAFGFGYLCDQLSGGNADVVFGLEENVWNGRTSLQLKIKDVRLRAKA